MRYDRQKTDGRFFSHLLNGSLGLIDGSGNEKIAFDLIENRKPNALVFPLKTQARACVDVSNRQHRFKSRRRPRNTG